MMIWNEFKDISRIPKDGSIVLMAECRHSSGGNPYFGFLGLVQYVGLSQQGTDLYKELYGQHYCEEDLFEHFNYYMILNQPERSKREDS